MKRSAALLLIAPLAIGLAGCPDPAKDKPKATVGEGKAAATPKKPAPAPAEAKKAERPADGAGLEAITFDQSHGKIGFIGSKVTSQESGHFTAFSGTIHLDPKAVENSKAKVSVKTDSVTTDKERLTGHLKSPDFFDSANHPEATLEIQSVKAGGEGGTHTLSGQLTLRGKTHPISFPATLTVSDASVAVKAEFSINRKQFDINYPGAPDNLIRDDVLLQIDFTAPRSKAG